MYRNHKGQDFLFGALVGGAVATLASLLFTTKQGKKIQNKIIDTYENLESCVQEGFSQAEEKLEDGVETARHKAGQHLHKSKKDQDSK